MNGNNSGGGSVFERLEGVRIEASEMQDNMSKLASFFDKYAKDKRVHIQEGWLRIKEESMVLLFKRSKLIESKLRQICSEYEAIFDELNNKQEQLEISLSTTQLANQEARIEHDRELERSRCEFALRDLSSQSAIARLQRSFKTTSETIQAKANEIQASSQSANRLRSQQILHITKSFADSTSELDAMLSHSQQQSSAEWLSHCRQTGGRMTAASNHNATVAAYQPQDNMSTSMPLNLERISPINIRGNDPMMNSFLAARHQQSRDSPSMQSPIIPADHESSFESSSNDRSHLSTSKNEGKWESRFESPAEDRRDAQKELKHAIIYLAEHLDLLQGVNNLSECERSGHIELLMHHIQASVKDQDDHINRLGQADQFNKHAFKRKINDSEGADSPSTQLRAALMGSLTATREDNNGCGVGNSKGLHNSIMDLVQCDDDMSFRSRLSPLANQSADGGTSSSERGEFKHHVMQEDLLKVRQLESLFHTIRSPLKDGGGFSRGSHDDLFLGAEDAAERGGSNRYD